MSDCCLAKLGISPGKIIPEFFPETFHYGADVPNKTTAVTVNLQTRDKGATYTISGGGGSNKVPLKEGVLDIAVTVTSKDKVSMNTYTIRMKRQTKEEETFKARV